MGFSTDINLQHKEARRLDYQTFNDKRFSDHRLSQCADSPRERTGAWGGKPCAEQRRDYKGNRYIEGVWQRFILP
jgi:hypothetical protein